MLFFFYLNNVYEHLVHSGKYVIIIYFFYTIQPHLMSNNFIKIDIDENNISLMDSTLPNQQSAIY